jgi:glucose-1-phosphate thymidylyltransferase
VRAFALCRVSDAGLLVAIVEKPDRADDPHDFVSMNCWLMPPDVFEACRRIRPSVRGELEIADAVTWLLEERGVPFTAVISPDGVLDLSRRSDVASVSRALATVVASP